MTVMVLHPGIDWSVSDVESGLSAGLAAHGVTVVRQALSSDWIAAARDVDAVLVVSAILVHPGELDAVRAAGVPVYVLFTESPYDQASELAMAARVDGAWTMERESLAAFRAVNPQTAVLKHAWHPETHALTFEPKVGHDVVFVGSGFPERVTFLNAIDWTGIDLGLYGIWEDLGLKDEIAGCARGPVDNATAAGLYRRAKIGLNLYRRTSAPASSLNPRAYELAACGTFTVSQARDEATEVFGPMVAQCSTPKEAERLIRTALEWGGWRDALAAQMPRRVARDSWTDRAAQVLTDLASWTRRPVGAVSAVPDGPRRPWREAA